ncbi:MAG TPA: helix-hairpin-helix domain-containing protein [Flavipsychrobacter sp.]|nr:helix-hairpin-helix domain-containing protein [Flavipsychrobacter sp.]
MNNYEIADHFSMLAKLMDVHGENTFKSKSYSIAAYHIENLPKEIEEMDDAELFSLKGIGESTGKKIREIQQTGKFDPLQKIMAATPQGILEMLSIKGLGPKKIATIWKEMGIETLGELEYACVENRLVAVKGFGAKTQASILENISYYKKSQGFHLWAEVEMMAIDLRDKLQSAFPQKQFALTGAIRRQDEVLEFVEIVTDAEKEIITDQFQSIADAAIEEEPNNILIIRIPQHPVIKFYLTSKETFYHTLFVATGSSDFMEAFFEKYSLPETPQSEQEIFSQNKLAYIAPPLRETAIILQHASDGDLDELITAKDIKGIIHSHSTWSDGLDKIETMAKAARDQGFEYLVISDHSQAAYYAQGLTPEKIAVQHQEIDALNEKFAPFKIFKSIEADILGDGSLDYNERILSTFDLVIASVHSNLKMSLEKAMSRLLTAIQNPFTTILGHPTGRLLLSRKGYPIDHEKIIDACAEHNVVIEINANPHRLDIDWRWIEYAMKKGVLLSINPDAHSVKGYRDIYYGVMSAQKGGLTPSHNLSSYSLQEFELFLKKQAEKK